MSKKQKNEGGGPGPQQNVVSIDRCKAPDCKSRAKRASFCEEHYKWFKFGLITKSGEKPKDFDKKYLDFQKHQAA